MPTKSVKETAKGAIPMAWAVPPGGFESLLQSNAKAAEIWLESWSKLAGESAGFLGRRWKTDIELLEKIWSCRSPQELLQVQSEFFQRALVDYMKEAGKLADIETEAGVAEMEALDEGAREACGPEKKSPKS
ncbi:MAG: phasin family protein [Kiloniellaceae bacterium]